MKKPRTVAIEPHPFSKNGWIVRYTDRSKGQHHWAAQFEGLMENENGALVTRSKAWVENWVASQAHLTLSAKLGTVISHTTEPTNIATLNKAIKGIAS